jgi:hypothetical protein
MIPFINSTRGPVVLLRREAPPRWWLLLESLLAIPISFFVAILVFAWLLVAVPFLYFVFLVSASPVRQSLRARDAVATRHGETVLQSRADGTIEHITFDEKPVACAFALSALAVWMARLALSGQ